MTSNTFPTDAAAIDAVIFDVGNVLLDYDPRYLFDQLLPDRDAVEAFLNSVCTADWNLQQDLGRSWSAAVSMLVDAHPDHAELIRAYRARWQEMIRGPIDGSVDILRQLDAAGVELYALTNFSAETFEETVARFDFFSVFKDIVVSGVEGVVKPDPRIFRIAIDRFGVSPLNSVFIDDVAANVAAARAAGLNAVRFVSPENLRDALAALGLPIGAGQSASCSKPVRTLTQLRPSSATE